MTSAPARNELDGNGASPHLSAVSEEGTVDLVDAERAATAFLEALGVDLSSESRRATPRRIAALYADLLAPLPFDTTTFPNDEGYDELVVARSIPFHSLCEHHLLPFAGVAHVGYLPGERIVGLSKLARAVDFFCSRAGIRGLFSVPIAPDGPRAASADSLATEGLPWPRRHIETEPV